MTGTHFDVAVRAITAALGTRLAPGVTSFPQLFTPDGVIEVPFDGDGGTPPMRGRLALTAMVDALDGVLRFDQVTVTHVHDVEPSTVICEYEALLHRADLASSFRRRYIAVMTMQDRRIANLREYGGPLVPCE
jgi:ketosteroid isomerase-like protein